MHQTFASNAKSGRRLSRQRQHEQYQSGGHCKKKVNCVCVGFRAELSVKQPRVPIKHPDRPEQELA